MKQICMKCGAAYDAPTGTCTALVPTERVIEGELLTHNLPCGSMQWCYPGPEPVVATPAQVSQDKRTGKA